MTSESNPAHMRMLAAVTAVTLLAVFGFMVYRNLHKPRGEQQLVQSEAPPESAKQPEAGKKPEDPADAGVVSLLDPTPVPAAKPEAHSENPFGDLASNAAPQAAPPTLQPPTPAPTAAPPTLAAPATAKADNTAKPNETAKPEGENPFAQADPPAPAKEAAPPSLAAPALVASAPPALTPPAEQPTAPPVAPQAEPDAFQEPVVKEDAKQPEPAAKPVATAQAESLPIGQPEAPAASPTAPTLPLLEPPSAPANAPVAEKPVEIPVKQPQPAAPAATDTYAVQAHDNYWTISRKKYGTSRYSLALLELNKDKIPDAARMAAGMQVVTPPIDFLETSMAAFLPKEAAVYVADDDAPQLKGEFRVTKEGQPVFRAAESDTLKQIAARHLGRPSRWVQIYELNRDQLPNPKQLKPGMELRLPSDASNVAVAHEEAERH